MGVRLILVHPQWARRSCADCIKYRYGDDGEIVRQPLKIGLPLLRPTNVPTPCQKCPKIPDGMPHTPSSAVEISAKNLQAFLFDCECRAVGRWPDDPIVRRNAAIIRVVRDDWEREPMVRILHLLSGVIGG